MADQVTALLSPTRIVENSSLSITNTAKEWQFVDATTNPVGKPTFKITLWSSAAWLFGTEGASADYIPVDAGEKFTASIPSGSSIFVKTASGTGTLYGVRVG